MACLKLLNVPIVRLIALDVWRVHIQILQATTEKRLEEKKSIKKEGLPVGIQPSPKVPGAREAGDSQLNVEPAVPTVGGGST